MLTVTFSLNDVYAVVMFANRYSLNDVYAVVMFANSYV